MTHPSAPDARRHDMDALRAFAMLLGIALHAALAYIGIGWIVSEERASLGLGIMVGAIHGFRMPLFFLLSGYFSAMLWRNRGLAHLLSQRARRILLPLALGCVTIIPLMWAVSNWAVSQKSLLMREAAATRTPRDRAPTSDIWTVAAFGDLEGLRAYTAGSELLDAQDPTFGVTPLGWTAIKNTPEATAFLLQMGANPSAPYRDRNTPLHTACFFGRAEVAELLLRAKADLNALSATRERPADAMRHDRQTTQFIANLLKVPVDFEAVAAGRERIRRLIAGTDVGPTPTAVMANSSPSAAESWRILDLLRSELLFQHLWFLWVLCWLNAGFALVVLLADRLPGVRLPAVLAGSPICLLWLVPLTMVAQSWMHSGGTVPGFGPDASAGLIPSPHVLLMYATFFGFGAWVFIARGPAARLGRSWTIMLPAALLVLPFGLMFGYHDERAAALVPAESARQWISCALQALYAWLMTLGLIGLFESLLAKPRPWVRYLSDSAYWLYLAHLPLIIGGQALLLRVDLHPLLKFLILTLATTALLLLSYRSLIRHTPIGTLLNGRRTRLSGR